MNSQERQDNRQPVSSAVLPQDHKGTYSGDRRDRYSYHFLDRWDRIIYTIVGACFLFAAFLALIYTFWALGIGIIGLQRIPIDQQPVNGAQAIIEFVSGLLLVLIIMEMLGTVIHYLRVRTTSLRPYLVIGIISATRSILSLGARLSVEGLNITGSDFTHAIIEMSVSAGVILALSITIKLLGNLTRIDE